MARVERLGLQDGLSHMFNPRRLTGAILRNEAQAVNGIHDVLKAYHKVAIKLYGAFGD